MQLFIRSQSLHCLEFNGTESVSTLKQKVSEIEGVALENEIFSHGGIPMNDEDSLIDAGLGNLSTIDVSSRLLGGKVHGSLARAGKVKGQTPKVDPQEKKKSKTGRAKRRMQYNRRFVNVVQTFGRRRGPNSNQS